MRTAWKLLAFLMLVVTAPATATMIQVEYIDNDGPQWTGYVDTVADELTILTWSEGAGGEQFWALSGLPETWKATTTIPNPEYPRPSDDPYIPVDYDVPDDWNGQFSGDWAFLGVDILRDIRSGWGGYLAKEMCNCLASTGNGIARWPVGPVNPLPDRQDYSNSFPDTLRIVVPEPSSLALLIVAMLALPSLRRRLAW